jgi:hypothetical protein
MDHTLANGEALFEKLRALNVEGMVMKVRTVSTHSLAAAAG